MIHYDLLCPADHAFDGWFRSSADFDAQTAKGLVACPSCGSETVRKALMAPSLGRCAAPSAICPGTASDADAASNAEPAPATDVALLSDREQALRAMLKAVREQVTRNAENVGDRFPEVARQMHAEEIEQRSVYGRASRAEAHALAEEGIVVQPLPRFPDEGN